MVMDIFVCGMDSSKHERQPQPISQGPEWSDVIPVSQNDAPNSIVRFTYLERFTEIMGYFRAIFCMRFDFFILS
ncbi:putative transferase [Helianthus anomalus]